MENKIRHVGIVESVGKNCVRVRIVQNSACSMCSAAAQCHASESKEKLVDVYTAENYRVGQKVLVMASYNAGFYALTMAMLVPMAILIIALFATMASGMNEVSAALTSLSTLIPYYIILYIFRKRISRKVSFGIEATDDE